MYGRDSWCGPLEINATDSNTVDDRSRNLQYLHRAAPPPPPRPLDETQQSWLLGPTVPKKKRYIDLGCILINRKIFLWTLETVLVTTFLVGSITVTVKTMPPHKDKPPQPDNYTLALHRALMFFNAQKSGKLPENNNVKWRSDSCTKDGKDGERSFYKDLVGGYYDAGDAIKFNFPMSYAMTMLSWSVIEYRAKYESAGELDHVKELIKWGTDYFLKTFNSSSDTINVMVEQVGSGDTRGGSVAHNDHYCWMRPEDIDYKRNVFTCNGGCSDLASEMAAALASASIVSMDNLDYSETLVHGAKTLYKFAESTKHSYSKPQEESSEFYKSSLIWDDLLWGGVWLYYATGNVTYLGQVTNHVMARRAGAFYGNSSYYGVFSWDNKLLGAQIDYILGKNPSNMSYVVGFGQRYPRHVHHRGASIPKSVKKGTCKGGWKWRDTKRQDPNIIVGAMVAGPDKGDKFHDVRRNYIYTEPTLAGNAGLVAALVPLSGGKTVGGIDRNTIFSAIPPFGPETPPPPAPWTP